MFSLLLSTRNTCAEPVRECHSLVLFGGGWVVANGILVTAQSPRIFFPLFGIDFWELGAWTLSWDLASGSSICMNFCHDSFKYINQWHRIGIYFRTAKKFGVYDRKKCTLFSIYLVKYWLSSFVVC